MVVMHNLYLKWKYIWLSKKFKHKTCAYKLQKKTCTETRSTSLCFGKSTRRNQPLPCSDLAVPMQGLPSSAKVIS